MICFIGNWKQNRFNFVQINKCKQLLDKRTKRHSSNQRTHHVYKENTLLIGFIVFYFKDNFPSKENGEEYTEKFLISQIKERTIYQTIR